MENRVRRANRNKAMKGRSWVYFARAGDGPVKIGQSRQVHVRIQALATAHHEEVALLGMIPETVVSEQRLLDCFARSCIRGEWFHPIPELLELAEAGRRLYEGGVVGLEADRNLEAWHVISQYAARAGWQPAIRWLETQGTRSPEIAPEIARLTEVSE